jgi:hypothetical protein
MITSTEAGDGMIMNINGAIFEARTKASHEKRMGEALGPSGCTTEMSMRDRTHGRVGREISEKIFTSKKARKSAA